MSVSTVDFIPFMSIECVEKTLFIYPHYEFFYPYDSKEQNTILQQTVPNLDYQLFLSKPLLVLKQTKEKYDWKVHFSILENGLLNIDQILFTQQTFKNKQVVCESLCFEQKSFVLDYCCF